MNETKIFKGLMLSRSGVLLVSIIIGSLLGGFAAAAMQNYHYQREVFPQYQAKAAVQEKTGAFQASGCSFTPPADKSMTSLI